MSQSPLASCARTVNFYPEVLEEEAAKARVVLYPSPGLRLVADAGDNNVGRGLLSQSGRGFGVWGTHFKEITATDPAAEFEEWLATLIERGSVNADANPVQMAANGDGGQEVAISSGNRLYMFDLLTNTLNGPLFVGTTHVGFLNSRFVSLDGKTSKMRMSKLLDGMTWDPTDETQRSDAQDPWLAMAVSQVTKDIWLLGENTGSIYYDDGTSTFPLVPRQGTLIQPGIRAPFSLAEVNGNMMWLAHSKSGAGTVVRARGYQTEIVSTEAVHFAIKEYMRRTTIGDAVAYTYEEQGHHFYVLNFPSANATWVFDERTGWWHERGRFVGMVGQYDAFGPQYHTHEFKRHLVQDHRNGRLFDQAIDYYNDSDGHPLRRLRIAPGIVNEQKRIYYDVFRLYLERGLGRLNATPLEDDPIIALRLSNDGGKTWGSEWFRRAGRQGEFLEPYVEWTNCGSATDRVFEVHMTAPIPWRIIDAYLTVRMGR